MLTRRVSAGLWCALLSAGISTAQIPRRGPLPGPRRPSPVRQDAWRVVGPGGGGAQYTPSVNPRDPNMVLMSCDMGGNYISRDGGRTWRMFNLRGQATFFSFDAGNPRVIYAGADRAIWRSEDDGDIWELVYPDQKTVKGIV